MKKITKKTKPVKSVKKAKKAKRVAKVQLSEKPNFLEGEFSLPKAEEEVLKFWDERKIFQKSVEINKREKRGAGKGKSFVFYEGPPTANGRPGVHHILSRAFKDAIPRYKTMQGFYTPRKGGWDTHGLPVEIQVEKQLGIKSKKEIEQYGVAAFNQKCRESVWEFKDEWERMTKRMGYWLDLDDPYITYQPEYMETLWWVIAQFSKKKMLYKGHRVVPWCTRCGTALSSHELAQGYKEVTDNSVYVKFKLKAGQKIGNFTTDEKTYILSWTTTPWTLPGNVALAVGEKIEYEIAKASTNTSSEEIFIFAKDLFEKIRDQYQLSKPGEGLGGSTNAIVHFANKLVVEGKDLVGLEYKPLFDVKPLKSEKSYKVYPADFVTTTDGTGVVHTAVMYGEDDYQLGKKIGLPQKHTVTEEGKFTADVAVLEGMYAKSNGTEEKIFEHLKANGNLLRTEAYKHEYPHCWRCNTAILYYARTSWFVGMASLRKELLAANNTVNWMPEHIREGRFGEWLKEAKDWNFSRERYWGTPLPIWECAKCEHAEVVGSLDELDALSVGGEKNHYIAMRHGDAFGNEFGIIDSGNQKFHLTAKGKREVEATVKKLKKQKFDAIFASDFPRTKESAEIVAKALGVSTIHYDKRLHEIFLASLSGTRLEEYRKTFRGAVTPENRLGDHAVPGAESLKDVRARAWNFLADVEKKYQGKKILIVSHEDTIWMLSQAALGWSDKKAVAMKDGVGGVFMKPASTVEFEVKRISRDATGEADMHKPFVDDVVLACPKCTSHMRRVPEVADVWYDSGSMPYAQGHWPFSHGVVASGTKPPVLFPADYIAEGVDQTRGWFYTLLAVSTVLGFDAPYKNVVVLGHINDKNGQKMSKSKGNIVDPWAMMATYGVDAVRWYFYTATPAGEPKNFDEQEILKTSRKVHLIIYNSFVFWRTYAKKGIQLKAEISQIKTANVLDQWILARLAETVAAVTKSMDAFDIREAGVVMESFVDDLSRWYIRRSRRRLQRPLNAKDYASASETLGFALLTLAKLMAPLTPFFAEMLYSGMAGQKSMKESVHLEAWPKTMSLKPKDSKLIQEMKLVRDFATMGLAKRAELKLKVRQPLASMTVGAKLSKELAGILADEVNVKKILVSPKLKDSALLDTVITAELREEGIAREIARSIQELRQTANLEPKDSIAVSLELPDSLRGTIQKRESFLKSDVGAKSVEYRKSAKFTAEQAAKIEGQDIWIGIRKV